MARSGMATRLTIAGFIRTADGHTQIGRFLQVKCAGIARGSQNSIRESFESGRLVPAFRDDLSWDLWQVPSADAGL